MYVILCRNNCRNVCDQSSLAVRTALIIYLNLPKQIKGVRNITAYNLHH